MFPSSEPSVVDSQNACESGCYQQGESIVSWLNRVSNDINTQCKKSHILDMLAAGNYDAQTLIDVGDHVNTPVEVHLVLATHDDADLRFALAENHNLHESVLNVLIEDANPYVAHRARMTLEAHPANVQSASSVVPNNPLASRILNLVPSSVTEDVKFGPTTNPTSFRTSKLEKRS
jgi:hypothetical protein